MELVRALWFALPVIAAGATQIGVIRKGALVALGRWPLDGGLHLRGRRLLGANKTWRGLTVMTITTAAVASALALVPGAAALSVGEAQIARPWLWGGALGLGYVLGELPNSFVKRQLDIAPGAAAAGRRAPLFWVIDQVDSLAGVLLAARTFGPLPITTVAWLLAITLVVHPLAAWVMVALGLKRRVG